MSARFLRSLQALAVWFTVVTLATSSLALPRAESRAPERTEHTSTHPAARTTRIGIGRDGVVGEPRTTELQSSSPRSGERSIHRIANEGRQPRRETPAPERREVKKTPAPESAVVKRAPAAPARDWNHAPAIVEHTTTGEVFAVSDLHGRYEETFHLLEANKVLKGSLESPTKVVWTGGTATVVVVGDVINKGGGSIRIIDLLRTLQKDAADKGGKVIVTMGNHEASFLHEPLSERSLRNDTRVGFGQELKAAGQSPELVARGADPEGRGQWLRELPFAAKVNDYFFLHSGNSRGLDRPALSAVIERAFGEGGFGHEELIGEDAKSVLGAEDWAVTVSEAKTNAEKLGVNHIVMGHIPSALDAHGEIARSQDGVIIKLDTGLGNGDADARMLRIGRKGGTKQLDRAGVRSKIKKRGP